MVSAEYDFWLLDLDGTLVDVDWDYPREVFDRVGDRLGREFTDHEVEILWHGLGGSRDEQLKRWDIDPTEFWAAHHAVEDPQVRAENTFLYTDAEFVRNLDGPVGLVTHCQEFLAEPVLTHLDIGDWFDTVVCCTDDLGWKPDPAPLERAMADLGVGHNGHVGVLAGDGPHDIGAAWNAGLDAVHIERHDPHRRQQCVLGDYRVESFDELWSESRHPVEGSD